MLDFSYEAQEKFLTEIVSNDKEIYTFLAKPAAYAAERGVGLSAEVLKELPVLGAIRETMQAAPGGAASAASAAGSAARTLGAGLLGGVMGALGARAVDAALSIDADMSAMADVDSRIK